MSQMDDTTKQRIAAINRRITKAGVSSRQVALRAKLDPAHLYRVLNGHVTKPTWNTFRRIEKSVEYFEA